LVIRLPLTTGAALLLAVSAVHAQQASGDGISLRATLSSDTVFVGQQLTYTLSVRIPMALRQRLRRNPVFVPPEPRAMLAYDLPLARVGEPGEAVEIHTFRRALFVLTPGRYALGQARLSYAVPQSNSFFSREDERTLRADGLGVVAIEPPLGGRPADWAGAVGRWSAALRAEPTATRVGDPFVLVLRLEGTGNATLLPRPAITVAWADVVPQSERVTLDSTPALFGGVKEFTWLVTPREVGAQTIAALGYATFDPASRRYQRIATAPVHVMVEPGALADVPRRVGTVAPDAPLALRHRFSDAATWRLPTSRWWIWLALLAPWPWLWRRFAARRRHAPRPEVVGLPPSARAVLARGLKDRTGLDLAAFPTPGALTQALRLEGVTDETARGVEALRDICDRDGYASEAMASPSTFVTGAGATRGALSATATALLAKVDAEARRRALLLLLLALGLVGCGAATPGSDAAQAFADGRRAYEGGDYPRAREAFARTTTLAPRNPAAWANYGNAAWQAHDTAAAVVGWQRALRLHPRAPDLRARLARVPAPQHRSARVWPIPPALLLAGGLALWLVGWGWAAAQARQRRPSRWALLAIVPGALGVVLALVVERQLAAADLVVIADRSPLRTLPALGADAGSMPMTGEVAQVLERRGVWLRLELDGGRSGWYPAERARSIRRD
jgi:tetratricopeptide (TPR) repeat protein